MLQIEACAQCNFKLARNTSYDTNLMVGSSAAGGTCSGSFISGGVIYDGSIGYTTSAPSSLISSCVDPAAVISIPTYGTFH